MRLSSQGFVFLLFSFFKAIGDKWLRCCGLAQHPLLPPSPPPSFPGPCRKLTFSNRDLKCGVCQSRSASTPLLPFSPSVDHNASLKLRACAARIQPSPLSLLPPLPLSGGGGYRAVWRCYVFPRLVFFFLGFRQIHRMLDRKVVFFFPLVSKLLQRVRRHNSRAARFGGTFSLPLFF